MWAKTHAEKIALAEAWVEEIREILSISAMLNFWSISIKLDKGDSQMSTIEIDIDGDLAVAINIDSIDKEYDVFAESEEMENRFEFYGISQEEICVSFKKQSEAMELLTNVFVEYSIYQKKEA